MSLPVTILVSCVLRTQSQFLGNFPSNSLPFSKGHFERSGPGYCRPLLLEEGVSESRGPHYHVLLWIRDAPLIDRDDP